MSTRQQCNRFELTSPFFAIDLTKHRATRDRRARGARAMRAALEMLEGRTLLSTFLVSTAADAGIGSLRQAILNANAAPGRDLIAFNINGGGLAIITPITQLPPVTEQVTIDAATQPGYAGRPLIGINGASQRDSYDGVTILAGSSLLRGLSISGFNQGNDVVFDGAGGNRITASYLGLDVRGNPNTDYSGMGNGIFAVSSNNLIDGNVISGSAGSGIVITGDGTIVQGNLIGTDPTGTYGLANEWAAIIVQGANSLIGGPTAAARNVISGNWDGVQVTSAPGTTTIQGNYIGLDITGHYAIPNYIDGVHVRNSAVTIAGNVISANYSHGIELSSASGSLIVGNYIGTDADGVSDGTLGNYANGIMIADDSSNDVVGGTTPEARNVISGNWGDGIRVVTSPDATGNVIAGNYIGTDATGALALGNYGSGVTVVGANLHISGNVLSGNWGSGITLGIHWYYPTESYDLAVNNVISANRIGVAADGSTALPNAQDGILIAGIHNTVDDQNIIAYNGAGSGFAYNGITIEYGQGNQIRGNSIYANPGLGIDLIAPDATRGVTPNDSLGHNGPNLYQNFPVISDAALQNGTLTVTGTLTAAASSTYILDFYSNPAADPSGYGQGQTYLGSVTITTGTNGVGAFTATFANAAVSFITATATDSSGSTSELSASVQSHIVLVTISPTTTTLTSSNTSSLAGEPVTFDATVVALTGSNAPTGTVSFYDGETLLGTATLTNGSATLTTSDLAIGAHQVSAVYNGDTHCTGSSASVAQTVSPVPATLSGYVYLDRNNNAARDAGETGIAGVPLTLTGTNDLGQDVLLTTTTDATGAYNFADLRPGAYTITETQPATYFDGKDTAGTAGGTAVDDAISGIVVVSATNGQENNFGELTPASLSGFAYYDANNNGLKDAGETGISGVRLTLTGTDDRGNSVLLTAVSDATGAYAFANLRPGTYTILETQPISYLDGKDTAGNLGGTASNDAIANVSLTSGAAASNYNLGELMPATLSGYVYFDKNDNGLRDIREDGIAGVTITLTGTNDLGQSVSLTATTDSSGAYSFTALRPGTYTITVAHPSAYSPGQVAAGTVGGTVTNNAISGIAVNSAATGQDYAFGELKRKGKPPRA